MNKEFIPYQEALALKELGFDELCFAWYDGKYTSSINQDYCKNSKEWLTTIHCAAPLYQQAFRWFREKHKLLCLPEPTGSWRYSCHYRSEDKDGKHWVGYLRDKENKIIFYDSYEEAELACLKKLIEIAKETK
jgi:hypothetical protein